MHFQKLLVPLLMTAVTAGCYRYTPVQLPAVPADEEVRVRFTDPAISRLSTQLGRVAEQLDGRVQDSGGDSLLVSVPVGRFAVDPRFSSLEQRITIARSEVAEVRQRKLSLGRTALATAGVVGAFVILIKAIVQEEDPNTGGGYVPPPPPPAEYRGFRIQIGF